MAARLWPKAWLYWLGAVIGSFALLEDAGFRRHLHLTLSRRTAQIPHAALIVAVAGPVACWVYAAHIARLEEELP